MAEAKAFKMIPHCTKDTITYEMEELVMCKDCKHWESEDGTFGMCKICHSVSSSNGWFCADGERMGGR